MTAQGEASDPPAAPRYVLRLYVTGSTPRSARSIENMHRICAEHLDGRVDLEVIDIYQRPEAAREFQVIAAPTLLKLLPEPVRRLVGDLSDREKVLHSLDLLPLNDGGETQRD